MGCKRGGLAVVGLTQGRGRREAAPALALRPIGRAIRDCVRCVVLQCLLRGPPGDGEQGLRQRSRSAMRSSDVVCVQVDSFGVGWVGCRSAKRACGGHGAFGGAAPDGPQGAGRGLVERARAAARGRTNPEGSRTTAEPVSARGLKAREGALGRTRSAGRGEAMQVSTARATAKQFGLRSPRRSRRLWRLSDGAGWSLWTHLSRRCRQARCDDRVRPPLSRAC
jgi:hypothetical protein